jgi:hypothetical protein
MQLIEYFIWSKTFSNILLSKIAYGLILLQPYISIINIKNNVNLISYMLFGYTIYFIFCLFYIKNIKFITKKAKNGHLAWYWLDFPLYSLLPWFFFAYIQFIINKQYLIFIFFIILAIVSYILYNKTLTWGSLWCWICNFISFYLIIKVFYKELCTI